MFALVGCRESARHDAVDSSAFVAVEAEAPPIAREASAPSGDAMPSGGPVFAMGPTKSTSDALSPTRILIPTPLGALAVWAREEGDTSEIVARAIDPRGNWNGKARLLRRTSGSVEQVAAAVSEGDLWVAWGSASKRSAFVATVRATLNLESVSTPLTLVTTSGEGLSVGAHSIAITPAQKGVAIAYPAGKARCKDDSGEMVPCLEFAVSLVDRTFAQKPMFKHSLNVGPDIAIDALTDVGHGVAISAFGWHGGAEVANYYLPYDGSAPRALPSCRPPHQMHYVEGKLILFCPADFYAKGETCPLAKDDLCPRVAAIDPASNDPLKLTIVTRDHTRCSPNRARELEWGGGKAAIADERPPVEIDANGKVRPSRCP